MRDLGTTVQEPCVEPASRGFKFAQVELARVQKREEPEIPKGPEVSSSLRREFAKFVVKRPKTALFQAIISFLQIFCREKTVVAHNSGLKGGFYSVKCLETHINV